MSIKRLVIMSMMTAIAIVASILESFIPVFVPGVKLGLANVIILLMLYEFKWYEALGVNIVRIILVGLMRGTFLSPTFLMSLSGGMLSYLIMFIFSRFKFFSQIGVSVLGSISHATGQILIAVIIMGTDAVLYYLPFIALLSLATGIFSGFICRILIKRKIISQFLTE